MISSDPVSRTNSGEVTMSENHLNCEGMNCPMPIVALTKTARTLQEGDVIKVTATDLAFKPDVEAWARRMGHTLESYEHTGDVQAAVIVLGPRK